MTETRDKGTPHPTRKCLVCGQDALVRRDGPLVQTLREERDAALRKAEAAEANLQALTTGNLYARSVKERIALRADLIALKGELDTLQFAAASVVQKATALALNPAISIVPTELLDTLRALLPVDDNPSDKREEAAT